MHPRVCPSYVTPRRETRCVSRVCLSAGTVSDLELLQNPHTCHPRSPDFANALRWHPLFDPWDMRSVSISSKGMAERPDPDTAESLTTGDHDHRGRCRGGPRTGDRPGSSLWLRRAGGWPGEVNRWVVKIQFVPREPENPAGAQSTEWLHGYRTNPVRRADKTTAYRAPRLLGTPLGASWRRTTGPVSSWGTQSAHCAPLMSSQPATGRHMIVGEDES